MDIGCGRGSLGICDAVWEFANKVSGERGWGVEGYGGVEAFHGLSSPGMRLEYKNWNLRSVPLV